MDIGRPVLFFGVSIANPAFREGPDYRAAVGVPGGFGSPLLQTVNASQASLDLGGMWYNVIHCVLFVLKEQLLNARSGCTRWLVF